MSLNEADTRYHLIDPVLHDKNYTSHERTTLAAATDRTRRDPKNHRCTTTRTYRALM